MRDTLSLSLSWRDVGHTAALTSEERGKILLIAENGSAASIEGKNSFYRGKCTRLRRGVSKQLGLHTAVSREGVEFGVDSFSLTFRGLNKSS